MTEQPSFTLGIGTWAWGDKWTWGYGQGYGDSDVHAAFQASLRAGITFFDTAEIYGFGQSERLLGAFARESGAAIQIATKFAAYPWRFLGSQLHSALRGSLRRLGVPQVALYQIHWPLPGFSPEHWMPALADAVQQGLTQTVGVSNFSAEQMRRAHDALAKRGVPLASNQVEYSLLKRSPERNGLLATCRELGVTLIAYSPLGMGLLTGKYTPENPPPRSRARQIRVDLAQLQPLIGLMREVGSAHGGKTPAQVALNWTICQGTLPIPGAKNLRQAEENVGALGWSLATEEVAALDEASEKVYSAS